MIFCTIFYYICLSLKNKDAPEVRCERPPQRLYSYTRYKRIQGNTFNAVNKNLPSFIAPSLPILEQSFQVRLEAFVLEAHKPLDHYQNADLPTTQEQLELHLLQLQFLLNDIRMIQQWKLLQ